MNANNKPLVEHRWEYSEVEHRHICKKPDGFFVRNEFKFPPICYGCGAVVTDRELSAFWANQPIDNTYKNIVLDMIARQVLNAPA